MYNGVCHKKPQGFYPERRQQPENRLESLWQNTIGAYVAGGSRVSGKLDYIVSAIGNLDEQFSQFSKEALARATADTKNELRLHGTSVDSACRAFALIREVSRRQLGMRHYDVQLKGGWVLLNGMLAEMETGEGKTFTATLPACTMAMAGIPVHVITVNDYLAERDATLMRPVYEGLGISVGVVRHGMSPDERRQVYRCDVVYCTNKELVFDYLKDHLRQPQRPGAIAQRVQRLYGPFSQAGNLNLRGLYFGIVDEADSVLIDEARTPLIISGDGNAAFEEQMFQQAISFASAMQKDVDFTIDGQSRKPALTPEGRSRSMELAAREGGLWNVTKMREIFIEQAVTALHCFNRDVDYLVQDGKVVIVDEYTGRTMRDRSWERGLHQMIECKEGCVITTEKATLARMTYQMFFRRYHLLAGMTGTAREVARELWSVYRLKVVTIPTNRQLKREEEPQCTFSSIGEKDEEIVAQAKKYHSIGRPVLIGTPTVEASERISQQLERNNLPHRTLNAKQDKEEAEIIALAGMKGQITVATNMAGRGTDILLEQGVADMGGLHIIASERHTAGRIDRQLFGRCGRQGDPGTCCAYVSFEDELFKPYMSSLLMRLVLYLFKHYPVIGRYLARRFSRHAQKKIERRHSRLRQELLKHDESMKNVLAFSGEGE